MKPGKHDKGYSNRGTDSRAHLFQWLFAVRAPPTSLFKNKKKKKQVLQMDDGWTDSLHVFSPSGPASHPYWLFCSPWRLESTCYLLPSTPNRTCECLEVSSDGRSLTPGVRANSHVSAMYFYALKTSHHCVCLCFLIEF